MNKTISYSEARANLAEIWDKVVDDREIMRLSRRGKEDVVLISASEISSLLETMHLLKNKKNADRLFSALDAAEKREVAPSALDDLMTDLGMK